MTIDADSPADGLTVLFAGEDGLVVADEASTPAWTSSPWTLAGLVVVGCIAVTALLGVVVPVVADLVLGWAPQLLVL